MQKNTLIDKIARKFTQYLSSQDISKKSLKNYKSDLSHFTAWLLFKIRTWGVYADELGEAVPFISPTTAPDYLEYLTRNGIPKSTINRRLSTLRHLGNFLLTSQILDFNFMDGISNMSIENGQEEDHTIILDFEKHLGSENVSENTIKNYKSDVRQFIEWLEAKRKVQLESN
jgi:site-specific recombinase XerD